MIVDPALIPIFSLINEAIFGICDTQEKIVNTKNLHAAPAPVPTPPYHSVASLGSNLQKKPRGEFNFVDLRTLSQQNRPSDRHSDRHDQDPQVKKFKEAIRDAEKSTLVFNLDLGKVPIINQDTMSTKVTKALQTMAAKSDSCTGSIPKEDTVLALDDVLSIAKGIKFYGKTTKSYSNPKDKNSGTFCTIPVRYDFADKDSRIYAESVLKSKGKVQCSTPYPAIVREASKQIVDQVKTLHPNHYVKVNIDTGTMTFRVVKRPMLDDDTGKKTWSDACDPVPIPPECLDLSARKAPENFRILLPVCHMELEHVTEPQSQSQSAGPNPFLPKTGKTALVRREAKNR
jgi:hypothetical protein